MMQLKYFLIPVAVMFSLLSCINSGDPSENTATKSIATSNKKTIIVDVRTTAEWMDDGHANCSVNYPLDELDAKIESLKPFEKVIVVCRSGHRAGIAKEILEKAGIKNVENGGGWQNITCKILTSK